MSHFTRIVASPNSNARAATSVIVVSTMLEAVAGSAPYFFSASGTMAPLMLLMTQLPVIARNTTTLSLGATDKCMRVAAAYMAMAATSPVSYTHLRAHETRHDLVCRLLLE